MSIVFQIGFYYEYHFIIKELAEEFEGQFYIFLRKYCTFSVSIKKENYKNW